MFPILEWTGAEIVHTSGGDLFASQAGTLNVVTGEVEFLATYQGGTRRWAGASGQINVTG